MKDYVVYFWVLEKNSVILNNPLDHGIGIDFAKALDVTNFAEEWAKERNLDLSNLSKDDMEILKREVQMVEFRGIT